MPSPGFTPEKYWVWEHGRRWQLRAMSYNISLCLVCPPRFPAPNSPKGFYLVGCLCRL